METNCQEGPSRPSGGSSDNDEAMALCEAIIDASDNIPNLDPGFAEEMLEQVEDRGWISSAQIDALKRIADGFRIDY